MINASARYELLHANQQLIEFHLNRICGRARKAKPKRTDNDTISEKDEDVQSNAKPERLSQASSSIYGLHTSKHMYNPHQVMQQRLESMSPLVFGETLNFNSFLNSGAHFRPNL